MLTAMSRLTALLRPLLKAMPGSLAVSTISALACRPARPAITTAQRQALSNASSIQYGRNVAWSWGAGPIVVFVHGWGGRATQLAPLAVSVASQGFRAVAIEVGGHGSSPGRSTSWQRFLEDVPALVASLNEPVFAFVGHSAGALTVAATRMLSGLSASRYVCICPPSYPSTPIVLIERMLSPDASMLDAYKDHLAAQFHCRWEALEKGGAFAGLESETLFVHDIGDRTVPHTESDKLAMVCPRANFKKLDQGGHVEILISPALRELVIVHLLQQNASSGRQGL